MNAEEGCDDNVLESAALHLLVNISFVLECVLTQRSRRALSQRVVQHEAVQFAQSPLLLGVAGDGSARLGHGFLDCRHVAL